MALRFTSRQRFYSLPNYLFFSGWLRGWLCGIPAVSSYFLW
ncbi:hypothetical protein KKH3_07650 [Pectobacterium actinidiae]|nr:hypothetical protein KKH3_07650 [Pectobacterium actinidiae]